MDSGRGLVRAREACVVALIAGVAFAALLAPALFRGRVLFGVDTVTAQMPWSGAVRDAGGVPLEVANPALADQGMVFYPAYRWIGASARAGDWPLWNPLVYAGAPAAGNPQLGLFDPQVWLFGLVERVFGRRAADAALGWLAWGRLVAAAVGAYLLARTLGLQQRGAALAGASFATSGFLVGWLNHSLGHVAFFLPWVLLGLVGLGGRRPGLALAACTACFALAILGGHPETAFYIGAAGGLFVVGRAFSGAEHERRAARLGLAALALGTALAAVSLLPFLEYLQHSGALVARRLRPGPGEPDWLALGIALVALGAGLRWRELAPAPSKLVTVALMALGAAAVCALLFARGAEPAVRLLLWPDLFGAPGKSPRGYGGAGSYLEEASTWLAPATLALALAGCFLRENGGLARRGTLLALGAAALLLALRTPGLAELYEHVPFVGLAAPVRLAPVGALMIALLAGEGLERAERGARVGAALFFGLLALLCLGHAPLPDLPPTLRAADPPDGLVTFTRLPSRGGAEGVRLEGWVHPELPVASIRALAARWTEAAGFVEDAGYELPCELAPHPWLGGPGGPGELEEPPKNIPEGAQWFRASFLWLDYLADGHWRFSVELLDDHGQLIGKRVAGVATIERPPRPSTAGWVFLVTSLAAVACLPATPLAAWALVLLALANGLWFAFGLNPAVPQEQCFPATRTEELLARELAGPLPRRYLSDPGVLPANTGMVRGLAALDGYDGLDPAAFDGYRMYALQPGVQPLLGWNARGMDLDSAAFRLFGVGALGLAAPLEHPGWELVAAPDDSAPELAECWIYRARDPLPRAFVVPRAVEKQAVLADLAGFDPRNSAFLEDSSWSAAQPFTRADVRPLEYANDRVRLEVELDGDGLLVLTEQHFPGWQVAVDGEPRELLRVDSIFRGVVLPPGEHEVVFRYRPLSLQIGVAITLVSSAALALCVFLVQRRAAHA